MYTSGDKCYCGAQKEYLDVYKGHGMKAMQRIRNILGRLRGEHTNIYLYIYVQEVHAVAYCA